MKKLIFINFFFGELPWYYDFFLKSCEANPNIDFIFFVDTNINRNLPQNVKIVYITLQELNELASKKLCLETKIKRPYKFCDFKPAFGKIFEDYLFKYDFWAFCDIDIVLGRVREFFTEDLLTEYDIISVRDDYPSGFFMLFRNTEIVNTLYTKSKDYAKIFTSSRNFCFDECSFRYGAIERGINIFDANCETESMLHVLLREQEKNEVKILMDFMVIESTPGKLKWNNGLLTYKNEFEVLLYHFVSYKYNVFTKKKNWNKIPNIFYIDKYNIRNKKIITNYFSIWWIDFIKPYLFKLNIKFDKFLSKKLFKKQVKSLKEGKYFIGDTFYEIKNDEKGNNYLSTYDESVNIENNIPIYNLFFNKGYFYIIHHNLIYKYDSEHITIIRKNGDTNRYDWRLK